MARIDDISEAQMERNSVHDPVEATYTVFSDADGKRYLQIDTYGSPGRQLPGKKSQSIQLSPQAIEKLRAILSAL